MTIDPAEVFEAVVESNNKPLSLAGVLEVTGKQRWHRNRRAAGGNLSSVTSCECQGCYVLLGGLEWKKERKLHPAAS